MTTWNRKVKEIRPSKSLKEAAHSISVRFKTGTV